MLMECVVITWDFIFRIKQGNVQMLESAGAHFIETSLCLKAKVF